MGTFLDSFILQFGRSVPLFLLIGLGYALSRRGGFPKEASGALTRFAFNVALTSMLFRIMSRMHLSENSADPLLLIPYFGACFAVFFLARLVSGKALRLNPTESSVFGTGCVFSNVGLLGLPLALAVLGEKYVPCVALVLSVNAMILWTLVSVTIELSSQRGTFTARAFLRTLLGVFRNPLIIAIFSGAAWNLTRIELPYFIDEPMRMLAATATPLSLVVVGMGLAEYGLRSGLATGAILAACKLCIQPAAVYCLARLVGLGPVETTAVTFIAALPTGVNVYLMSRTFRSLEGPVASAMLLSTAAASVTVPIAVTLLGS